MTFWETNEYTYIEKKRRCFMDLIELGKKKLQMPKKQKD